MLLKLLLLKYTAFLLLVPMAIGIPLSCASQAKEETKDSSTPLGMTEELNDKNLKIAANRIEAYLPLLEGKRVAIVANQTSVIFHDRTGSLSLGERATHLVDSLLSLGINVKKVFAPEHGFRGNADAGEHIADGTDTKTGLPLLSLHGKNRKPTQEQIEGIDLVIFDIQDVGARFYTYISTLHYVMEACAEADIPAMVLDRPNPNGHYVDGPILESEFKSFLGMHPIPIVHGMTIAEYAQMINGEGWLKDGLQCELMVIPMKNYTHETPYSLPIKPSPNLPNDVAINLYPSICFFEQTPASLGRGTDMQFQVLGVPYGADLYGFSFTPRPNEGSKYPKHENVTVWGLDLRNSERLSEIKLDWLIDFYKQHQEYGDRKPFFWKYFYRLAGTKKLEEQIKAGMTTEQIKATWQEDLKKFKKTRATYLLYP